MYTLRDSETRLKLVEIITSSGLNLNKTHEKSCIQVKRCKEIVPILHKRLAKLS